MLDARGRVHALAAGETGVTYAGVGIYTRALFDGVAPGKLPLRPLLDDAIGRGVLGGLFHDGQWEDVGTPERLEALNARVSGA
jgi:MurNAc alpha-1-phosphate uridylyltransferase